MGTIFHWDQCLKPMFTKGVDKLFNKFQPTYMLRYETILFVFVAHFKILCSFAPLLSLLRSSQVHLGTLMDSLYLESLSPMLSWGVNCGEFLGFNVLAQWYPRVVLFWCSEGRKEGLLALQASTLPSCLHVRWSVHATACTQHCTLYRRGTSYLDIGHVVAGQYRQPSNSLSDNLFTHKFARLLAGGVIQGKFVFSIESHTI